MNAEAMGLQADSGSEGEDLVADSKRQEALQKPARRQVADMKRDIAYVEGNYDYNIWYDKFLTDRNAIIERAPSMTRCKPETDSGFTKADTFQKKGATYFCAYFPRGACS